MLRWAGVAGTVLCILGMVIFAVAGNAENPAEAHAATSFGMIAGAIIAIIGLILGTGAFTTWLIVGMAGVTSKKDSP